MTARRGECRYKYKGTLTLGGENILSPLTEEPAAEAETDRAQHRAALDPFVRGLRLVVLGEQLAIDLGVRGIRTRPRAAFGGRDPSADQRERLGRASGARPRRMNLFTVETEPGHTKLHA